MLQKHYVKFVKILKLKNLYLDHQALFMEIKRKFPILENAKPNPKNVYAKTKLQSEGIINKTFLKVEQIL